MSLHPEQKSFMNVTLLNYCPHALAIYSVKTHALALFSFTNDDSSTWMRPIRMCLRCLATLLPLASKGFNMNYCHPSYIIKHLSFKFASSIISLSFAIYI